MLLEEFLEPLGLSASELEAALPVERGAIAALAGGQHRVTPELANCLGDHFGMSAGYWRSLQARWELHRARE